MKKPITLFDLLEVAHDGVDADLDARIYGMCEGIDARLMGISAKIVDQDLVLKFVRVASGEPAARK